MSSATETDQGPAAPSRGWPSWTVAIGLLALVAVCAGVGALLIGGWGGDAATVDEAQWRGLVRQARELGDLGAPGDATGTRAPAVDPARSAAEADAPEGSGTLPDEGAVAGPRAGPQRTGATRPPLPEPDPERLERQWAEYRAARNKSVLELQPHRRATTIDVRDEAGRRGRATLTDLAPRSNAWYLLTLQWEGEASPSHYHLVNNAPDLQALRLDAEFPFGVVLVDTVGGRPCHLWSSQAAPGLAAAISRGTPYVTLCDQAVTLRLPVTGRKTTMERVTDFLRDNVWGGEQITVFVRETFFQDAHLATAELVDAEAVRVSQESSAAPRPARVAPELEGQLLSPTGLGLPLDNDVPGRVAVGRWYRARANPGVWVSVVRPNVVHPEILETYSNIVVRLDEVEAAALAYLVAFDLELFDIGFGVGTDHPRVGWSDRVAVERRPPGLVGPDGIDSIAPLAATGIVPPAATPRTVATFTGGFKRTHGAFRYGELATVNNGSHYGFVEQGVVLSKLQPGLSTLLALDDGRVVMKTWTAEDEALLEHVRFARQNGVPIIRWDPELEAGVPGPDVARYGPGNWSGSQEGRYRTLRAGACLLENDSRRFLVYGYFSSATPSAMARVFQAYGCRYAMLLDMNALEHTYMALYRVAEAGLVVQHLIEGMEVLDRKQEGRTLPRFLAFADNRDFFYVVRRRAPARSRADVTP